MSDNYPEMRSEMRKTLGRMACHMPEVMKSVGAIHDAAYVEGAITTKQKELIALGISISTRCQDCIALHTYEALTQRLRRSSSASVLPFRWAKAQR